MTIALEIDGGSALTIAWVRSAFAWMVVEIPGEKESQRVARADETLLADVRAAADGNGDAYGRIIGRFQDTIARRMARFTRDKQMLEELVHDVFVEAYFSLGSYRGDAPFEHWLQRIATRVGYRYWTRRGRETATSLRLQLNEPATESGEAVQDTADVVAVVLEQLSPRDRLVLTLLYLESRSIAETADLAGWSETMVKVQAHRARKRFRRLLEESPKRSRERERRNG